jgi:ribonuclease R
VKMFAFLNAQLKSARPQPYGALVTDVRNFGFFVDVPGLGMSGLVPLSGLSDDFYQFDSVRSQLIGRRTRRVIKLGEKVEVQVAKVDTFKRQVDFKLAGPQGPAPRHGHRAGHRRPEAKINAASLRFQHGSPATQGRSFSRRPSAPGRSGPSRPRHGRGR